MYKPLRLLVLLGDQGAIFSPGSSSSCMLVVAVLWPFIPLGCFEVSDSKSFTVTLRHVIVTSAMHVSWAVMQSRVGPGHMPIIDGPRDWDENRRGPGRLPALHGPKIRTAYLYH